MATVELGRHGRFAGAGRGGFIIIGKRLQPNRFQFNGYRIPFVYALHAPADTIHGDGTIVGEHAICGAAATAEADTVLLYSENTCAKAGNMFAEN